MNAIRTPRLILIPATAESLSAELISPRALGELLGCDVPASWPPELYDADAVRWTLTWLAEHPDREVFASFPGAGPTLAPRLLAAVGSQRERYASANRLQCFSGIAPVLKQSGQSRYVHRRYRCPKFLRQSFHEYAGESIRHSTWARLYYAQQKSRGHKHHTIVRALAFKWIRIIFRCWQNQERYDESRYLRVLKQNGSPLAAACET